MDAVPAGPLDATLDWVVTEKEAIRCGERQSAVGNPQS
jgi:hypothetical protein